ncbi:MAG: hypothetical protein AAGI37_17935 [Planctomycetota bacterium]
MLHPNQTFTLDVDDGNEDAKEHRVFTFRYGSAADYMEVDDLLDDVAKLNTRAVHTALSARLADTQDDRRLAETTTPTEQVAMLVRLEVAQSVSESLAKKSKPPLQ